MRSDRINIFKFATLSVAIHTLGLVSWPTPIMLTYGTETVLSVRFFFEMPDDVTSAVAKSASTSHEPLAEKNVKRPQSRHARDNERDSNFGTTTRMRTVTKLEINNTPRKPKDIREDAMVMEKAAPMLFPEPSKAAPSKARPHQRRRLDKPIAMSSIIRFRHPVKSTNMTTGSVTKSATANIRGRLRTDLARHPFSEPSKAAPFKARPHQRRRLDKPIAMSSMVKFRHPLTTVNTTAAGEAKSASAHIRGRLRTDLARYFSYPAIARQRGWQGHVQIGFRVQPDGTLTNIYIARSSGYRLLDKSALKALRQVESLAEAATLLKGQSVDMELPVIYKLDQP